MIFVDFDPMLKVEENAVVDARPPRSWRQANARAGKLKYFGGAILAFALATAGIGFRHVKYAESGGMAPAQADELTALLNNLRDLKPRNVSPDLRALARGVVQKKSKVDRKEDIEAWAKTLADSVAGADD